MPQCTRLLAIHAVRELRSTLIHLPGIDAVRMVGCLKFQCKVTLVHCSHILRCRRSLDALIEKIGAIVVSSVVTAKNMALRRCLREYFDHQYYC